MVGFVGFFFNSYALISISDFMKDFGRGQMKHWLQKIKDKSFLLSSSCLSSFCPVYLDNKLGIALKGNMVLVSHL